jgi:hypothetical protein
MGDGAIDYRRDPIEDIWSLGGPEELTADEVFEIAGEGGDPAHLDPASAAERLTALLEIPVSIRATEFFAGLPAASDHHAATSDAAVAFGVSTTPFEEGLRTVASKVSEGG